MYARWQNLALLAGVLGLGCSATHETPTGSSSKAGAVALANKMCPIMGHEVDVALTKTWNDRTVAFCCEECIPKWNELSDEDRTEKLASANDSTRRHHSHDHGSGHDHGHAYDHSH
jgi:hypothetical protein